MSKSSKPLTPEILIRTRKRYRRNNLIVSLVIGLAVLILAFAYMFLSIGYHGYADQKPLQLLTKWTFLDKLPYFDTTIPLLDLILGKIRSDTFFHDDLLYRVLLMVGVLVLSVLLATLYGVLHGRSLSKKYRSLYLSVLQNEVANYGVTFGTLPFEDCQTVFKDANESIKLSGALDPVCKSALSLASPLLSWNGVQLTYQYKNKTRDAFLLGASLENPKAEGFIQLRNYGKPLISDYLGQKLEKYGFADNNNLARFVCYSTHGQEIYKLIDASVAQEVFNLQHFLSSSLVITLAGSNLFVLIDGFKLNLTRPLKMKITSELIGRQAEAIASLDQVFVNLAKVFTKSDLPTFEESPSNGLE